MTSKERVVTALRHKEPDRLPLDIGSTVVTGISRRALLSYLAFKNIPHGDIPLYDVVQQLGCVPEDVLRRWGVDCRPLDPSPSSRWKLDIRREGDSDRFYDEWGIGWRKPVGSDLYYDMFHFPLAPAESTDDIAHYPWPDPEDPARYEGMADKAKRIDDAGPAVVCGRMAPGIMEIAAWMRGFESFFIDLLADPDFAGALLDKVTEIKMRYWEIALGLAGDRVVVVSEADDLATQTSLVMSPDDYRRLIQPRHKRLFSFIKKLAPNAFIFFHSCGAISELIPYLLEAGIDILNPVQVSATGMDTKRLKREFGDTLSFWGGGVDTQHVLPHGTPTEVRDEVRRRVDDLAPGGGFVFNTVHNVQADVPPENLDAMFSVLEEYGVRGE